MRGFAHVNPRSRSGMLALARSVGWGDRVELVRDPAQSWYGVVVLRAGARFVNYPELGNAFVGAPADLAYEVVEVVLDVTRVEDGD